MSVESVNIYFHVPSSEEIRVAIRLVHETVNDCIDFLNKASKKSTLKEEVHRELNLLYQVLYASSRLLKRPSGQETITEQLVVFIFVKFRDIRFLRGFKLKVSRPR